MIRISINWDFTSPILQIISGTLMIEDVDLVNSYTTLLIHCKVKKEKMSITYNAIEGINLPTKLWNIFESQVYTMVDSYFAGMLLKKDQYDWVYDSDHKTLEEWKETHKIDNDDKDIIYSRCQSDGLRKTKQKNR